MSYHLRLQENPGLAESHLQTLLKAVQPPLVYGAWDYAEQYAQVPVDVRTAFSDLITATLSMEKGTTPPGLTILGEPGAGKTRALYALAEHLLRSTWHGKKLYRMEVQPMMVEHIDWVQMVRTTTRFGESSETRSEAQSYIKDVERFPGFLFLDDVGVSAMPDFVAEAFYALVDHRLKNWRPTIFVSNASPHELTQSLDPRITHRLLRWTKVVKYPPTT